MSDMKMKRFFTPVLMLGIVLLAHQTQAQNTQAKSQLRRTVDPSDRSAFGAVTMKKSRGIETLDVQIKDLSLESFALWHNDDPTFNSNNVDRSLAPLDRVNEKKGTWDRKLEGVGGAPPEFVRLGFADLDDLAGGRLDIANTSNNKLIIGVTNIVGNVTNVIFGIPVPTSDVTNDLLVSLWAPLPALSAKPSAQSYHRKTTMEPPAGLPAPSPGASASIDIKFTGTTGRSVFDVRAKKLVRGQVYTVYIADSTDPTSFLLISAGTMTAQGSGSNVRFTRDTKFGDPLPQQARDVGDLSGRVIQIRDANGFFIHLDGVTP